jgi:hypothetical protein
MSAVTRASLKAAGSAGPCVRQTRARPILYGAVAGPGIANRRDEAVDPVLRPERQTAKAAARADASNLVTPTGIEPVFSP